MSSGSGGSGGGSGGGSLGESNEGFCSLCSFVGSFLLLSGQHPVVELSPPSVTFSLQDLIDLLIGDVG